MPTIPTGPAEPPTDDREPLPDNTSAATDRRVRRSRRWRRIRRAAYLLAALLPLVVLAACWIGYQVWQVPDPARVAAGQQQTVVLTYSDGNTELGRLVPANGARTLVRYQDIPPQVRNAVLAAENRTFWSDDGFSFRGIAGAVWNNLSGSAGGGSTITQQYVKQATNHDEHTVGRKFKELVLAKKLSDSYDKPTILTAYLNTVYFGRGAYGIQAAAQAYFGKDVGRLDVAEAALLAGVIQRPTYWDPAVDRADSEKRWNYVLDQLVADGWLAPGDRAATRFPVTVPRSAGTPSSRLHIEDRVFAELDERAGIRRDEAQAQGYRIVTTIDKDAQPALETAAHRALGDHPGDLRAAAVSIRPTTGAVAAYFGGSDGTGLDFARTAAEPGSTFALFAGVAAAEAGLHPDDPVANTAACATRDHARPGGPACTVGAAVRQADPLALAALTDRLGADAVATAAHQAGIPDRLDDRPTTGGTPDPRIALGVGTTARPLDLAVAAATLAADGQRTTPHFVAEVRAGTGELVYRADELATAAFPAATGNVAHLADGLLGPTVDGATGVTVRRPGVQRYGSDGRVSAAWFVGYGPALATAVWLGADRPEPITAPDPVTGVHDITGDREPAEIWYAVMAAFPHPQPVSWTSSPNPVPAVVPDPPHPE